MEDNQEVSAEALQKFFGEAAEAALKMIRLIKEFGDIGGYTQCVNWCKQAFPSDPESMRVCIQGCATVSAPQPQKLAPIE